MDFTTGFTSTDFCSTDFVPEWAFFGACSIGISDIYYPEN